MKEEIKREHGIRSQYNLPFSQAFVVGKGRGKGRDKGRGEGRCKGRGKGRGEGRGVGWG